MQELELVKAWKDEDYRDTLENPCAELRENPAGAIEFEQPSLQQQSQFGPAPIACCRKSISFIRTVNAG
jgi:mersacidin/lichenicidin family type 2 lantibiotic